MPAQVLVLVLESQVLDNNTANLLQACLVHFLHFTERYLENPVYASTTTKKKIHCSERLQLTLTHYS